MKICILNGDMNSEDLNFTKKIDFRVEELKDSHEVEVFQLKDMNILSCHGCFHCWVKTPGICVLKDDAAMVHKAVINADLVLFASPLKLGFTSSVLKKMTDRLIVLLHPYIKLKQGEMHHEKRYASYPDFGILIQKENNTDKEDLQILRDIYDRIALNFHAKVQFMEDIDNPETNLVQLLANQ